VLGVLGDRSEVSGGDRSGVPGGLGELVRQARRNDGHIGVVPVNTLALTLFTYIEVYAIRYDCLTNRPGSHDVSFLSCCLDSFLTRLRPFLLKNRLLSV